MGDDSRQASVLKVLQGAHLAALGLLQAEDSSAVRELVQGAFLVLVRGGEVDELLSAASASGWAVDRKSSTWLFNLLQGAQDGCIVGVQPLLLRCVL